MGLTHPAYTPPVTRPGGFGPPRQIDWQTDAKHYQFWVRGDEQGNFTIPNVRPGKYTLHAFADGVLGEYAQGRRHRRSRASRSTWASCAWTPVRRGKQLWDIGIPNRNGSEFFQGRRLRRPGDLAEVRHALSRTT